MKKIIIALSLCLALLLGLCVYLETRTQTPTAPTAPTDPISHTVQFQVLGATVSTQTVVAGSMPQALTGSFAGLRIEGWLDPSGNPADPFTTAVIADVRYTAVAYPELTTHGAYLFTDANGMLWPDEALTGDALAMALQALAAPGAEVYFPTLPTGAEPLTREALVTTLSAFFEEAAVTAAVPGQEPLTRTAFAAVMQTLLGRSGDETFTLPEGYVLPSDVTSDRTDASLLLEACVPHTPAESGTRWQELELISPYEPGFVLVDGWLYYVDEERYLLRDGYLGELYFGADGRYTCGDAVLDQTVAVLLDTFIRTNPEATRFELLRMAFDYCHQSFGYRRSWDDHPAKGSHGWEVQRAKDIFESGKGNCYGFAAAFWALARGLGYEARAISGVVLSDEQPHSWCFIEFDGMDYIFDPQWQFDYTRREIYEYDMFYLPSNDIYFWGYQWFE